MPSPIVSPLASRHGSEALVAPQVLCRAELDATLGGAIDRGRRFGLVSVADAGFRGQEVSTPAPTAWQAFGDQEQDRGFGA